MIVEYIRYVVPSDRQDAFVADWTAALAPLLRSPHARSAEVGRCVEDPSHFVVRIVWSSAEDHMERFRGSAEFRDFLPHIRAYIPDIQEMRHYDPVASG